VDFWNATCKEQVARAKYVVHRLMNRILARRSLFEMMSTFQNHKATIFYRIMTGPYPVGQYKEDVHQSPCLVSYPPHQEGSTWKEASRFMRVVSEEHVEMA